MRETFYRENSILETKAGIAPTFLAAAVFGKGSLTIPREPSSIFIPSEENYTSPAATFSNLFLGRLSSLVRSAASVTNSWIPFPPQGRMVSALQ